MHYNPVRHGASKSPFICRPRQVSTDRWSCGKHACHRKVSHRANESRPHAFLDPVMELLRYITGGERLIGNRFLQKGAKWFPALMWIVLEESVVCSRASDQRGMLVVHLLAVALQVPTEVMTVGLGPAAVDVAASRWSVTLGRTMCRALRQRTSSLCRIWP